jgi:uncharacterized protein YcgI (DUF1989 family)
VNLYKEIFIKPQTGASFVLKKGHKCRVIDVKGKQVADLVAFCLTNPKEKLSTGVTIDNNSSLNIRIGDYLFSNKYNKLLKIVTDTVKKHDLLYPACSPEMYRSQYSTTEYHPSCQENLSKALKEYGITAEQIPDPFNIFMNISVDRKGNLTVEEPLSKAGEHIELEAEMDLIIAVAACSVDESKCNAYGCKPILVEIFT